MLVIDTLVSGERRRSQRLNPNKYTPLLVKGQDARSETLMLAMAGLEENNGTVKTIKFGFKKSADTSRSFITLTVPPRVQDGLEFKYRSTLQEIKRAQSKSIIIEKTGDVTRYIIDTRVMGNAVPMNRISGAKRALSLILAAQHMAQPLENNGKLIRPNMLDPAIQIRPSVSKLLGRHSLGVKIAWTEASLKNATTARMLAHERMTQMRHDLLDPQGPIENSARFVITNVNLSSGIILGVGQPIEKLHVPNYGPLAPSQRFEGETTNYEHQFVLMAGALVLAEAAELATE